MKKLADDCFIHDKDRMTHEEAISLLRSRMEMLTRKETVELTEANGRILAGNITAPRDIPFFNNSAVDGYAFSHREYELNGGFFPVKQRIAAGDSDVPPLAGFSAARIFTGARMPDGADTVAMQEDCDTHDAAAKTFVTIPSGLKLGANCRLAGEDVESGETVATEGQILEPQNLAAIASTGASKLKVRKPLKIGLLSSGNEILRPGEPFADGKVYDANHFMLLGLMDNPNFKVTDLGICPDQQDTLEKFLTEAAESHDAILTTGGASRGEEDHFVSALEKLGSCYMWQLAIKPGRPMSFGQVAGTPCFTLPGNPVAAFVCFLNYVRPALMCLAGGEWKEPERYPLPSAFAIKSKPDRREFLRGYLLKTDSGRRFVQKFERDGSGLISGLTAATGLIEIEEKTTFIAEGQTVTFLPFSGFLA